MVITRTFLLAISFFCAPLVGAAPTPAVVSRNAVVTLGQSQIDIFTPYTHYAGAGYCDPSTTLSWTCGANCNANPTFKPISSGGDGSLTQFWYVGYDSTLETVVVAHQGTDTSKIIPLITDSDFILGELDQALFPGLNPSLKVHSGFANEQARTATTILSAVQQAMSDHSATHVTLVGHSLGGALALLDSVYLPLHLPVGTTFKTVTYSMPRIGNQEFADYVDAHVSLTHINNKKDIVPILPGLFLGFHHPSGEIHIDESGAWISCPGQDNTDNECIVGDVPDVFAGNTDDHNGPFNGVSTSC